MLQHGYKMTALSNSDTHGTTKVSGCPRNYIMVDGDEPIELDDARFLKGRWKGLQPMDFVFFANGNPSITMGSTTSGKARIYRGTSPSWYDVSSLEIYRNGTLIDVKEVR